MASIADTEHPPAERSEGFRPSMLLNDSRYRGITLQVLTMALVAYGVWWLVNNTLDNLAAQGKELSFAFLWQPSGYDIDQALIDYSSRSTNARAAVVGILNTLLVAAMGIVTATILGVLAGVARLSSNWLVARIMTVYVEVVRNVPLLIWILLSIAICSVAFPSPRAAYEPNEAVWAAFTNRGMYITVPDFLEGSWVVLAALGAGLVAAWAYRRYALREQMKDGQQRPWVKVGLALILVPPVIAFFLAGQPIALDQPALRGFNIAGGFRISVALFALWVGLSIYTAAFIAEVVRGGIQAVSKGQREAAFALGLQPGRVMSLVVLPQALRIIIPPLISQYLNLTKNSSLAIATGYFDITGTLAGITLSKTGRELECLLLLMAFYLTVSLTISAAMNVYNKRVALKER